MGAEKKDCNTVIKIDHGKELLPDYTGIGKSPPCDRVGYICCGGNLLNGQCIDKGVGIPGVPENDYEFPEHDEGDILRRYPYIPGFGKNDYLRSTLIPKVMDDALAAAKAQAKKDCDKESGCCKSVTISFDCTAEVKGMESEHWRRFLRGRGETNDLLPKCGKAFSLNCSTGEWTE